MQNLHKIVLHLLFWVVFQGMYWGRQIYILRIQNLPVDDCFYIDKGFELLVHLIHFYAFYFFIYPKIFLKGFRLVSTPILGITLVLIFYFRAYVNVVVYNQFGAVCGFSECDSHLVHWFHVANTLIVTGLSTLVYTAISWADTQQQKIELSSQNRASELALLRAQINPHFLFNTLNNIYYLTTQRMSNAGTAILRLSEIMRYMLKEANTAKVPLDKEIAYIQSFIDLQRLRIKNANSIELSVEGKTKGLQIAPMLLIAFVENAFKYGVNDLNSGVEINLLLNKSVLSFNVLNYFDPDSLSENTGFGLENVRRRLELIYADRAQLEILKDLNQRTFLVKLKLNLADED